MGLARTTMNSYRSKCKRWERIYALMPDEHPEKGKVLKIIKDYKDKLGLEMTEQEFNDFYYAKPGRPPDRPDEQKILRGVTPNSDEKLRQLQEEYKRKYPGMVDEKGNIRAEEVSEAELQEMIAKYPPPNSEQVASAQPESVDEYGKRRRNSEQDADETGWACWAD
jgi:hypothetical protein